MSAHAGDFAPHVCPSVCCRPGTSRTLCRWMQPADWLPRTLPYPAKASNGSYTHLSSGCAHDGSPKPTLLPGHQYKTTLVPYTALHGLPGVGPLLLLLDGPLGLASCLRLRQHALRGCPQAPASSFKGLQCAAAA